MNELEKQIIGFVYCLGKRLQGHADAAMDGDITIDQLIEWCEKEDKEISQIIAGLLTDLKLQKIELKTRLITNFNL